MTVYNLAEDNATNYHGASAPLLSVTAGRAIPVSVTAKSTNRQVIIQFAKADGSGGVNANFDLVTGQTFGTLQWGAVIGSIGAPTLSNGICSVTFTPNFTGQVKLALWITENELANSIYQGDGTSFIEVDAITISGVASDLGTYTLNAATRTVVNTGAGVASLNNLVGAVSIVAGANTTVTASGQNITVAAGPGPQGPQGVPGTNGINGTNGTNGAPGVGVPAGGATAQVLTKRSGTDFDTVWATPTSGSVSTFGVNVLDFGADPTGQADSITAFERAMLARGATANLPRRSYGAVYVPLGKYRFSRELSPFIGGDSLGVRIIGEAVAPKFFGDSATSSTILCPSGGFGFASRDGNLSNGLSFQIENMCFSTGDGGGGVYMVNGGLTVRNCLFIGGGHQIQLDGAWKSYIGQCVFRGTGRNNPQSVGCLINGQEVTLDTVDFEQMGKAVVLAGESHEVRQMRCESSQYALVLGEDQNGNQNFLNGFRISVGEMESNTRHIWIRNASQGVIEFLPIIGHEIYDGEVLTESGVFVDNAVGVTLNLDFSGIYSRAAIVSNGVNRCKLYMCRGGGGAEPAPNAVYPAGSQTIRLSRSSFDSALPGWLVPGLTVTSPFAPSALQPGTLVQQVIQPDTIVLSKPIAQQIIGSGYPPNNTAIQGTLLHFTGSDGLGRGALDGPQTGNWTQELCDLGA